MLWYQKYRHGSHTKVGEKFVVAVILYFTPKLYQNITIYGISCMELQFEVKTGNIY
jgi:hypothetical protein